MNISFLDNWRRRHGSGREQRTSHPDTSVDQEGVTELLSECELLRVQAESAGVELDDTPRSLEELDQLLPRWRDDPEITPWLGSDAGLYLGTVIVRTIAGAQWVIDAQDGAPVVRLSSGREMDVLEIGAEWAATGAPELSQMYAEVAEG
ncbi:DUF6278 family protein [Streptomyces sp. CMB-StM0423]|uniref:DUF6278 family protein n=1 Tax=Streptomyces sp. CMB-StM0423 TaxID=2059884 RepID=UPI000C702383|nr:DUF6278 family protein [Streptomyces sp. CMB-StM0423]AUH39726.1 hypothetical protein CXR04_05235 [Streptomyces sp. CMB-StM0423]